MKKSWRRNVKCMVFAAGFALALSCTAYADETTFVSGTSVNGLGISNMTVDQATQRIAYFYASDYKLTIKEKGGKTEVMHRAGKKLWVRTCSLFLRDNLIPFPGNIIRYVRVLRCRSPLRR